MSLHVYAQFRYDVTCKLSGLTPERIFKKNNEIFPLNFIVIIQVFFSNLLLIGLDQVSNKNTLVIHHHHHKKYIDKTKLLLNRTQCILDFLGDDVNK